MGNKLTVAILAIVAGMVFMMCSCSSSYKDKKALSRVLGSVQLRNDAYNGVVLEHPCIGKDSVIIGKDSLRIDTTIQVMDNYSHDTIIKAQPKIIIKTITKEHLRVDTISKRDSRFENFLQSKIDNQEGQITQMTTQIISEKKKSNKWFWLFISACGVIVAYTGFKIYSMFKPKLP